MTKTNIELWQDKFGDEYTTRNAPTEDNVNNRILSWGQILAALHKVCETIPETILEVGAGGGANLLAIDDLYFKVGMKCDLFAVEPNKSARMLLKDNMSKVNIIKEATAENIPLSDNSKDMVFTSGVLIHLNDANLKLAMKEIYRVSKRWIISVEYFSPEQREIPYRGKRDVLWSRDYGSIWLDNFNLRCISCGFFWKRVTGLDNVTFWIFEKVN